MKTYKRFIVEDLASDRRAADAAGKAVADKVKADDRLKERLAADRAAKSVEKRAVSDKNRRNAADRVDKGLVSQGRSPSLPKALRSKTPATGDNTPPTKRDTPTPADTGDVAVKSNQASAQTTANQFPTADALAKADEKAAAKGRHGLYHPGPIATFKGRARKSWGQLGSKAYDVPGNVAKGAWKGGKWALKQPIRGLNATRQAMKDSMKAGASGGPEGVERLKVS